MRAHTNSEQLIQCFKTMNPEYAIFIKQPQLQAVIDTFADTNSGFDLPVIYLDQRPDGLDEQIKKSKLTANLEEL